MQEEVDQKTIALAVKTGKLTAQVLQAAIRKYLAARQKGTGKAHHGQQSLRQLKKDGSALSNIEITDANIGLFKPCAKKWRKDPCPASDVATPAKWWPCPSWNTRKCRPSQQNGSRHSSPKQRLLASMRCTTSSWQPACGEVNCWG